MATKKKTSKPSASRGRERDRGEEREERSSRRSSGGGGGGYGRRGGGNRPDSTHFVMLSARVGKGEYKKGPSFSLWPNDGNGPIARGTLKDDRLEDVIDFLTAADKKGLPVQAALFERDGRHGGGGGRRSGGRYERDDGDGDRHERGGEKDWDL